MGDIFLKLLNMSITASWLILAVLGIRFLFRKIPRWVICLLWGVVAIRLIFPFSIESEFSLLPSAEPIKSSAAVGGEVMPYVPSVDSNLDIVDNMINPILAETFAYEETESTAPLQVVTGVAGNLWLCGMMGLFIFAVMSVFRLRLCVREAVRYKANIYICDTVKSPFILGIIKPKIYLSSALSGGKIDYIIAHEKAHLCRYDHLWKPFGYLLLCVYWFNPLCWIAYMMLCRDIELACDEKVIKNMSFEAKKEYSRVLLSCAAQRRLVSVCPLAFGEVGVRERVKSVLNYKRPAFWITALAIAACVIVAICFLTNPLVEDAESKNSIYEKVVARLGDEDTYAFLEMNYENMVLLISDLVYDTGTEKQAALYCDIYYYVDKEAKMLGTIMGDGTAYPIAFTTDGIFAASGHKIEKYVISEEGTLFLEKGIYEQFDEAGNVRYISMMGEQESESTEQEYQEMVNEYGRSQIVHFSYGAEGSVNTYHDKGTALIDSNQLEENAILQDLAYYLELSASDIQFRDMSEIKKTEILAEYGNLLDEYTLMARESTDGQTAYIVGHYNGEVTNSPLYKMQDMGHTSDKLYQIFYLEENYEAMDRIKDEQGVQAITDQGYVIKNSWLYRTINSEYIFIQPTDAKQELYSTFNKYMNPARGRRYIEDALARGIVLNEVNEPYLSVYMISEEYGEITEQIPLTIEEAEKILAEEPQKLTDGYGFGATLRIDGEAYYYSENKVPQSVFNLAVEKCRYRFASPKSIRFPILEACLDCSWIEEPLYLDEAHFSRLEEILKSAKLTGVGNCGYGAKLTLTLEKGETVVIFKGTDDCGSLVFGSWGGYSISDKADDEFWKMFGLNPNGDKRLISQDEYDTETEEEQKEYTENSEANTKKPVAETTRVDTSEISGIVVTNGNTGEQITLTAEASAYKDLLKLYWQLDFTAEYEENTRVGYQYRMKLLDADGNKLQSVTPYKDGIIVDRIFYKYDNTGEAAWASLMLMEYLESVFETEVNQQLSQKSGIRSDRSLQLQSGIEKYLV